MKIKDYLKEGKKRIINPPIKKLLLLALLIVVGEQSKEINKE